MPKFFAWGCGLLVGATLLVGFIYGIVSYSTRPDYTKCGTVTSVVPAVTEGGIFGGVQSAEAVLGDGTIVSGSDDGTTDIALTLHKGEYVCVLMDSDGIPKSVSSHHG